ncbi:MAG: type III pantothenate kinase [Anaeromicrobium sp.]|uniref:type III pantothenate kinase n=1 Tax=Anaeromicrobium sp. TaxID=1929132 RepID=UPI0025FDE9A6|nr:type III pantothenate kinase [Anaeromicrobium sp.]MCT4595911.1 type III pantothenate kinase [Anaeromicrobium sp.]
MILVVDVGNTNVVLGAFKGQELIGSWRLTTGTKRTSDEFGILLHSLIENRGLKTEDVKEVIVSSVVPNIMYSMINGIKKYFHIEPIIVGPGIKTGINIKTENPKEVGADRIVNCAGAYYTYGGPAIVIDFGTATTYDVVTEKGEFITGIISPGIKISADALWSRAAKLPNIEIKKPDSIMAKNTITSMQAGLVYGYIGQVEYIVNKVKEEMNNPNVKVIATGGLAKIIEEETDVIDVNDPLLTLNGLRIIYERNL